MISAIIIVLLAWIISFCVLTGLGQLVRSLFFRSFLPQQEESCFDCFWLGFVAAIALLLILHLVLPVDWKTSLVVAVLGVVGFVRLLREAKQPIPWRRLAFVI